MNREEYKLKMNPILNSLHPILRTPVYAESVAGGHDYEKQLAIMERMVAEFSDVNVALNQADDLKRALRLIAEASQRTDK